MAAEQGMVDRVAAAITKYGVRMYGGPWIYAVIGDDFDAPLHSGLSMEDAQKQAAILNARAAIEAMREPTREMLMASGFGRTQKAKWEAMVDQALGTPPKALRDIADARRALADVPAPASQRDDAGVADG